ncbi:MAG: hypothetical protein J6V69_01295, partial [Clostridia bacterium]|nr:hypothetical protein [Clostridia bacterium]
IDDNATYSLFDGTDNQTICENALKEVTEDSEYQFKVMNAKNIGKKVTEDQRVKLADMFGSKFETKK